MNEIKINILGKEVTLVRLKLRKWSQLEGIRKPLDTAISKKDFNTTFDMMVKLIEMAVSIPVEIDWSSVYWEDFIYLYSQVVSLNSPTIEFPILRSASKEKPQPWEYEGRSWYFWLNLFSSNYGWSEEVVAELDIDTAIGLFQEISIQEQMTKEWQWGLSEIAYPYDKSTKKSIYKPLTRPDWMAPMVPKQLPVVRIKQSHLPMGNIVDVQAEEVQRRAKRGV